MSNECYCVIYNISSNNSKKNKDPIYVYTDEYIDIEYDIFLAECIDKEYHRVEYTEYHYDREGNLVATYLIV